MVMMIVCCTGCGKSGEFDVHLQFQAERDRCNECFHDQSHPWNFQFCVLSCFIGWMKKKKVAKLGFPCQRCVDMRTGQPSGFAFGFKENGVCKSCEGKKTVKGRLVAVDPLAGVTPKIGATE